MSQQLTGTAIEQLLGYYTRYCLKAPLPHVDPRDDEALERLLVAICWAGDYTPYGYANGTLKAVNNLCSAVGVLHVEELIGFPEEELQHLVIVSCPQIPDLTSRQAIHVLFRTLTGLRNWYGFSPEPLTSLATSGPDFIRDTLEDLAPNAIPALYVCQALGVQKVRPNPTAGAAMMLARLGLTDWTLYLSAGVAELRRAARAALEALPLEVAVTCELWMQHCPDNCVYCPANQACHHLAAGLL